MYSIEQTGEGQSQKATVTFHDRLEHDDAQKLHDEMIELLENGCKDWEVDLLELATCDSQTLGLWVKLHTTVQKYTGNIGFKIEADSNIHRVVKSAFLDRLLSLDLK